MVSVHNCENSLAVHGIVPAEEWQWNDVTEGWEWMCLDCSEEMKSLLKTRANPDNWSDDMFDRVDQMLSDSNSYGPKAVDNSWVVDQRLTRTSIASQLPLSTEVTVGKSRKPLYKTRVCKHHLTPFSWKVGSNIDEDDDEYQVYLSASSDTGSTEQGPLPTACLYLASSWIRKDSILANFGQWRGEEEPYIVYCAWGDFKTIELDVAHQLATYAVDSLDKGHRLEIGCQGGHGRTGTMTGLVMVATGMDAERAIKTIRDGYCSKAIETKAQEDLIRKFAKERGE